jgi:hypothetical protein
VRYVNAGLKTGWVSPMLRTCCRIIALTAMVAGPTAEAADTTLTLACEGTTTDKMKDAKDAKPAPISMGIIVNFTKNTVQGFGIPGVSDHPVKIRGMNDARIVFDGAHDDGTSVASITGSIDRVTGDVEATDMLSNTKTGIVKSSTSYALKCTPTQRMF